MFNLAIQGLLRWNRRAVKKKNWKKQTNLHNSMQIFYHTIFEARVIWLLGVCLCMWSASEYT